MAALGAETSSGDFDVWDYCFAGMPHQEPLAPSTPEGEWVAIASGLEMGGANAVADVRAELMAEWLLGEAGGDEVRFSLPIPLALARARRADACPTSHRTRRRRHV